MFIKQDGKHIEIYECGVLLKRDEAMQLVEESLMTTDDPEGQAILQGALNRLKREVLS